MADPTTETFMLDSEGGREETSTLQPDFAEFEKRLRESLEARHQFDAALASVRSETHQQIADAKRAGESDRKVMEIERLGFTRSAELLTLKFPFDPPFEPLSGIAFIATHDLPLSDVARLTTASEQFFGPPYQGGRAESIPNTPASPPHEEKLQMFVNPKTGEVEATRLTGDRGGKFMVQAGVYISFRLNVKLNPDGSRPFRVGRMRIVPTFSGLEESYLVAASNNTFASSSGGVVASVSNLVDWEDLVLAEPLWNELAPPAAWSSVPSQTKTVSTGWFQANSSETYYAFVGVRIRVDGERDLDNIWARALGSIRGKIRSIRVSQFLVD